MRLLCERVAGGKRGIRIYLHLLGSVDEALREAGFLMPRKAKSGL